MWVSQVDMKKKLDFLIWMFFSFHLSISSWLWIELYNFFYLFSMKLSGQSPCIFFMLKKHINSVRIFFFFKKKKKSYRQHSAQNYIVYFKNRFESFEEMIIVYAFTKVWVYLPESRWIRRGNRDKRQIKISHLFR